MRVVCISDNHDHLAWHTPEDVRQALGRFGIITLLDESWEFNGVTFYGSGWLQPKIGMPGEYGDSFYKLWEKPPTGVDVLLTHQPPYGILDVSGPDGIIPGEHIGSTVIYWGSIPAYPATLPRLWTQSQRSRRTGDRWNNICKRKPL